MILLTIKLPLSLTEWDFSGFCPMLQCWFSFLSHYYNLLEISLPYFTTFPNVTYSHSVWFLLPTGSTLLFPLFNSLCCSSVCWDYLDCKSALCSICYPFSAQYRVLNSITQIINENTNWVEYGVDTHLPLQTFSQFNTQTLVNTFFVNCF